ncbi:MAG: hypothetical protein R3E79_05010 [Caldilineaceae bacterium]
MLQELTKNELAHLTEMIQQHPGFIPIDVQPKTDGHEVIWMNVGDYHFTKAKFEFAIRQLSTTKGEIATATTPIGVLADQFHLPDALYPTGFIFHMSRCGSTLFAKALARTPKHIVIDEGTPLNDGLWHYLTGGWQQPVATHEQALAIYKNLLLAMGRQRTPAQQTYFVKFRSWNALFIDFITQVFPDVPCLFLYRDPVEVLVSGQWKPVWTLDFKGLDAGAYLSQCPLPATVAMDDLTFLAKIYARYFQAALEAKTDLLYYLNYDQLTRSNFPAILAQAFHYHPTADQLALMQTQFDYYSKDDDDQIRFTSDKEAKQQAATQSIHQIVAREMGTFYQQLDDSNRNLAHHLL